MITNKIPKNTKGRRWVIADIHGCIKTLRALIEEKICLTTHDQLFLLGNYIDLGHHSRAVLDYLLTLQEKGVAVYALRGSSEERLLQMSLDDEEILIWYLEENNNLDLLDETGSHIENKYLDFFYNMAYYYETDDFYLVHAGLNFESKKPFEDRHSMLWIRDFEPKPEVLGSKRLVHGHQVVEVQTIRQAILEYSLAIPLNNGCAHVMDSSWDLDLFGNLCALNLDSLELILQPNLDMSIPQDIPQIQPID